jgi:hypothetical protein
MKLTIGQQIVFVTNKGDKIIKQKNWFHVILQNGNTGGGYQTIEKAILAVMGK